MPSDIPITFPDSFSRIIYVLSGEGTLSGEPSWRERFPTASESSFEVNIIEEAVEVVLLESKLMVTSVQESEISCGELTRVRVLARGN